MNAQTNSPPIANPNGPYYVSLNGNVVLNGSGSYDPDKEDRIVEYAWDLNADGFFDVFFNVAEINLIWHNVEDLVCKGHCRQGIEYPIILKVVDSFGEVGTGKTTLSVYLPGDVDADEKVNIFDLARVGKCFKTSPIGDCKNADLNRDGKIDIRDLATVGKSFGSTWKVMYTCCLGYLDETCFSATIEDCRAHGDAVMECIPFEFDHKAPPGAAVNLTPINRTQHEGWLKNLTDAVKNTSIPSKTYVPGSYDCDDFADDLERNLTAMGYNATYTVYWWDNGERAHAITDVRGPDGTIVFIEPQTGKIVDLDFDKDGKVEAKENEHSEDYNPTDNGKDIEIYDDAATATAKGCPRD